MWPKKSILTVKQKFQKRISHIQCVFKHLYRPTEFLFLLFKHPVISAALIPSQRLKFQKYIHCNIAVRISLRLISATYDSFRWAEMERKGQNISLLLCNLTSGYKVGILFASMLYLRNYIREREKWSFATILFWFWQVLWLFYIFCLCWKSHFTYSGQGPFHRCQEGSYSSRYRNLKLSWWICVFGYGSGIPRDARWVQIIRKSDYITWTSIQL